MTLLEQLQRVKSVGNSNGGTCLQLPLHYEQLDFLIAELYKDVA